MTTVSNLVAPTWWNAYAAGYGDKAEAKQASERLYRAEVPDAPDNATYKGYVYAKSGLLAGATGDVAVPDKALYLKHSDGSYFTIDFGDEAKVSLISKNDNHELYVYISEGTAERYEFDKITGNMVGDSPTELNALDISAIEAKLKVDIDFDSKAGASLVDTLDDGGRSASSLYKLNVLGTDVYAVGRRLNPDKQIDINKHALMQDADNLWEPEEEYDTFSVVTRTVTIVDEEAVPEVRDPDTGALIERARRAVTHNEQRYDVYLTLDPDPSRNFEGETLRLTFDDSRVLIQDGDDAPVYLDHAALARDEAVTKGDHNGDGAVGLNISATAVDATGDLYKGSILGQEFFVFGDFDRHNSATKGASLSGALLEADGETAWEVFPGFSVVAGIDTSYDDGTDTGTIVEQRTVLLKSDDNANEVLRFDFEVHTSALTDARGNAITSFKLIENDDTGKELTPHELAALEKAYKRDADQDGNFGVGMAASPIDQKGGLQLANALGVSFLMASKRAVSSARSPLDLSTAFTLEPNSDGSRSSWLPENVADVTNSNIHLITTDDGAGSTVYEIYVEEDASAGGAFARYSFDDSFAMIEDRYELTDDELAAAEVKYRRNLNADDYTYRNATKESYGVVINEAFVDRKSGLYSAEFEGESMFIKSDSRLMVGSFSHRKAVDFDAVLHDDIGAVWNLADFKIESDMGVTGAVQDGDSFLVFATSAADPSVVQKFTFEQDGTTNRWTLTGSEHEELLSLAELSTLESDHRKDLNGDDYKGATFVSREDKTSGLTQVRMAGTDFYIVEPNRRALSRLDNALYASDQGEAWVPDEAAFTSMVAATSDDGTEVYVYVANQPVDANDDPDYDNYSYSRYTFDATTGVLNPGSRTAIDLIDLAAEEVALGRDINLDRAIGAKVTSRIDRQGGLYETTMDGVTAYAVSGTKERALDLSAHAFLNQNGDSPWEGAENGYKLSALVVDEGADANVDTDNTYAIYATATTGGAAAEVRVYRFDSERKFVEAADITSATIGGDKGLVDLEIELSRDLNRDRAVGQIKDDTVDRRGGLFTTTVMGDTFYTIGSKLRTGRSAETGISLSMSLFDATGQNPWVPADGFTVAGVVANTNNDQIESYSVFSYSDSDSDGDPEHVEEAIWTVTGRDADGNPEALAFDTSKAADAVRLVELEKAERRDFSGDGVVGFRLDTTANEADDRNYFGVSKAEIYGDFTVFLAGENLRQGIKSNPLAQGNALLSQDGSSPWNIETGYQIVGAELSSDGTERYVYGKLTTNELNTRAEFIEYTFAKDTGIVQGQREISRHELMEREVAERKDLTADGSIGIKLATVSEINNDQGKWTGLIQATVGIGGETVLAADDAGTADVDESVPSTQTYLMLKKDPRPNKGDLSSALLNADGLAWELPSSGFEIKGTHVAPWDPNNSNSHRYLDVYGFESGTDAEIKRYRFEERWDEQHDPLFGNWVLMTDQNNRPVDMNTRELAEEEADAGKDLNGDGSIGFVYAGSAVASQSNGVTLGTANAKQASDVVGADDDVYIVGRNLDRMGTRTSNLANAAALFVDNGGQHNYWKPDTGFEVTQIWQNGDAVNLYAQNADNSKTLKYKFESHDVNGSPTWMMASATRAAVGMSSTEIVTDEAAARRDFNEDTFVGLDIGSSPTVGVFNASAEGDDFLVIGPDLVDGTASKPTDFTGVLLSDDKAWGAPEGYDVLSVIQNGDELRMLITSAAPAHDGTAMPNYFQLFFHRGDGNHGGFGDVTAYHMDDGSKLVDVTALTLADGDDGYDAAVDAANQNAAFTLDKLINEEYSFRRDLDGNGVVGMTIDPATNPVAPAVYSGTAYDQTAIMVSPDRALETGTALRPTSLTGAVITNTAADGEDPVYEFWEAGADQTITGASWSSDNVISFFVKDTSVADSHVVKKYGLTELEQNGNFKRVLATGENDVEDLTGASLIQEEVDRRMDLDGNGVVGVEISDDVSDHITGQLYKGLGLNADEVYYLVGYGLESGTASNPLGLQMALRDEDDADGNPVYWTPGDGVTIDDFEREVNGSFSQSVIDAIQDPDTDGEETPPDGAWYAATVTDSGTTSVKFFDGNRQLMTA